MTVSSKLAVVIPDDTSALELISENVATLLRYLEPDPDREGIQDTPDRVAKAMIFATSGYDENVPALLKVFKDGSEKYDELILVKDIPFYSKCEHHMEAIIGRATIGYIPNPSIGIVGLSKFGRVVDAYARRLQVQERITRQICDAIEEHLKPIGVGVVVRARHLCMEARGICKQGHSTTTHACRGVFREKPEARAEFLALAQSNEPL